MGELFVNFKKYLGDIIKEHPEYWGLMLIIVGLVFLFCSIKGYSFMYDHTGGAIFNTAWLRNVFGERVAKSFNIFLFSIITLVGLYFYFRYKS
ncbi:hypothetical protein [Myroides sp. DF42-4-2]|uniref:hypothetical protein n=1 Tax=Myroides sp. DF42-4-2 TaxID=2746726 RepID=UPI0025782F02|nr:hypothetical protein [Myroides sp. DF42-4-2]MDM1408936.1 hypothetical protein [Myroides sp. DF42-4-2]